MKSHLSKAVLLSIALAPFASASAAAEWGTLKGRVVYGGKAPTPKLLEATKDQEVCSKHTLVDESLVVGPDGGVANVVIFLRTKNPAVHPEYEKTAKDKVTLDNHNCRFEPHVQLLRTTQTLIAKNSDPVPHNSKLRGVANPEPNPLIPANDELPLTFSAEEALPMTVSCNIHPWMTAYVVVRSNPYMAVTDETGTFVIKNLPADKELEFQLWQEKAVYLKGVAFKGGKTDNRGRFKLKLKPGDTDLGDITGPASAFKR